MERASYADFNAGQGISWAAWAAAVQEEQVEAPVEAAAAARHEHQERQSVLNIQSMTSPFYECNSGGVDRFGGRDVKSA